MTESRRWVLLAASLCLLTAAVCRAPSADSEAPATVTLNSQLRYQTISGWEATAQAGQEFSDFPEYQDKLLDLAVNDVGINRLRLFIKSGAENPVDHFLKCLQSGCTEEERKKHQYQIVNDNNDAQNSRSTGFHFTELDLQIERIVLPFRRRLQDRGERLYINCNYVDFGASAFEHKEKPEEYAEFVLAVYDHLKARYGIVPDSWETILEPDRSNWTPRQVAGAIHAAGTRLQANGYPARFIAPSTASMEQAAEYFDAIAADARNIPFLWGISYHRYAGVSGSALNDIVTRAARYQLHTAMLEKIGAGFETLHQDLSEGRNSAWQQYTLAFPGERDNGSTYFVVDRKQPPNAPAVRIASRTRYLRQYFRYIRSGAVRIDARSSNAAFQPLAFINTGEKYTVVIKARKGGPLRIHGLPPGTYHVRYTTQVQADKAGADQVVQGGKALNTRIPARGVITVYR